MAWWVWLIAAGLLAAAETVSLDLVLLMLAGGALGGLAAALVTGSLAVQVGVFAVVSVGLFVLVRPVAKRQLVNRTAEQLDGVHSYVGRTGVVTERVDRRDGRITLGADVWSARTEYDGAVFEVGERVRIVQIEGPTAVVALALE